MLRRLAFKAPTSVIPVASRIVNLQVPLTRVAAFGSQDPEGIEEIGPRTKRPEPSGRVRSVGSGRCQAGSEQRRQDPRLRQTKRLGLSGGVAYVFGPDGRMNVRFLRSGDQMDNGKCSNTAGCRSMVHCGSKFSVRGLLSGVQGTLISRQIT